MRLEQIYGIIAKDGFTPYYICTAIALRNIFCHFVWKSRKVFVTLPLNNSEDFNGQVAGHIQDD